MNNSKPIKAMKKKKFFSFIFVALSFIFCSGAKAQLSFSAQLRPRFEYRNGYGTLKPKGNKAAFFASQRSRLNFQYTGGRVIFHTSVQDVRVWGQDASTITNADGNRLSLHEAWAEIVLADRKDTSFSHSKVDYFAIKVGRQELVYDDSRLLGNLDWLQQGRRHDALVLKLKDHGFQTDLGLAYNQNSDAINYSGTYYTPANVPAYVRDTKGNLMATPAGWIPFTNSAGWSTKTGTPAFLNPPSTNGLNQQYKAMQFVYAARMIGAAKVSALVVADEFGKYVLDSVRNISGADTGYMYGRHFNQPGVYARFTSGLLMNTPLNSKKTFFLTAGYYHQMGRDRDGFRLNAYTFTGSVLLIKGIWSFVVGWDYLSGNDAFSGSAVNHRFDPLYGTPHKFWGYMDYFYAGTGSPTGGLSNPYAKIKLTSKNKRLDAGIDYHYFSLAKQQKDANGNSISKYLGSELDVLFNYALNKYTSIGWGYSLMAATRSMEYAKAVPPGSVQLTNTWGFLQLDIKPEFLLK
jgi:hypothetical protein